MSRLSEAAGRRNWSKVIFLAACIGSSCGGTVDDNRGPAAPSDDGFEVGAIVDEQFTPFSESVPLEIEVGMAGGYLIRFEGRGGLLAQPCEQERCEYLTSLNLEGNELVMDRTTPMPQGERFDFVCWLVDDYWTGAGDVCALSGQVAKLQVSGPVDSPAPDVHTADVWLRVAEHAGCP